MRQLMLICAVIAVACAQSTSPQRLDPSPDASSTVLFDTRPRGKEYFVSSEQMREMFDELRNSHGVSDSAEEFLGGVVRMVRWAPPGGEQEALAGRYMTAPATGFFTAWEMFLSPGFTFNNSGAGQHQKTMLWLRGDLDDNGGSPSRLYMSMTRDGTNFRIDGLNYNSPPLAINPLYYTSMWQRWVVYIEPTTGTIRCWFNGNLVLNATRQNLGATGLSQVQQTVTTYPGLPGQYQAIRNLVVWW